MYISTRQHWFLKHLGHRIVVRIRRNNVFEHLLQTLEENTNAKSHYHDY